MPRPGAGLHGADARRGELGKDVESEDVESEDVESEDVESEDVESEDVESEDVEEKDVEEKDAVERVSALLSPWGQGSYSALGAGLLRRRGGRAPTGGVRGTSRPRSAIE